ncbi:hypothetical protein F5B21DRAFT_270496 [Xylaria acuta]|nr:hypothetical protein F5B21DRAFT_270496 [Xylaria acuta]
MHCESIWYFFDNAELDDARDTIAPERYWRREFATLFGCWIDRHPSADQMPGLASLWCSSTVGGWRAIAVSFRNKRLETGVFWGEIHKIRLSCKHEEYFETEFKHLEPIQMTIERNHWLGRAQLDQSVPDSQTLQRALEGAPALAMPETPPTQRRRRQSRQEDGDVARPTVTTSVQVTSGQRTTRSQLAKQDKLRHENTKAQPRKQGAQSGKEISFLYERTSSDRNDDSALSKTTPRKTTRGKTTRGNDTGNMGVIGGKFDSKTRRRALGTRKQGVK